MKNFSPSGKSMDMALNHAVRKALPPCQSVASAASISNDLLRGPNSRPSGLLLCGSAVMPRFYRYAESFTINKFGLSCIRTSLEGSVADGFWPVVLIIIFIIAWVLAKVIAYARKSEQQWREVDKSKLKEWEDDDEW